MGFRQNTSCLIEFLFRLRPYCGLRTLILQFRKYFFAFLIQFFFVQAIYAQGPSSKPAAPPATSAPVASSAAKKSTCPAPTASEEGPSKLRIVKVPQTAKKFKIKLDKGGANIGLPAPSGEQPPAAGECFFVLAANQQDVVAEISFQKITKNNKGVSVWVFAPVRRSEAGKSTLNLNAIQASALGSSETSEVSADLLPGENPVVLPSFLLIQNAQHQAANVRTGLALDIPVSGFGAVVESYVPRLAMGTWTNMLGLRINFASWSAGKFVFRKPSANDNQEATATGSSLQLDIMFRYPFANKWIPRLGISVSPVSTQTEILKAEASTTSPQNTQTLVRSGLVVGAEAEVQPSNHFFLQGRVSLSFKETVTVKDETASGENLTGNGTATRMHLSGIAGVRLPLTESRRFVFEGLVGNTYRSDKYSPEVANIGQEQQKDVITFFQAGFGYIL